ncbi:MAG: type II toxin-antitoxin system VapC family toxin [Verrucomicrobia bacterium]|nr:type II toxin-antitoxin system VapC family toxin [Verrucomicrobiota bacterium]
MGPFFDTGVALKLILAEPLSPKVLAFVKRRRMTIPTTRLIELEMETALNALTFRGAITTAELKSSRVLISEMIAQGKFSPAGISLDDIALESLRLSARIGPKTGCRTLDLMHIASALMLGSREFVSTDQRQLKAAKLAGLKIIDFSKP